jgi:uncharacterized metal-binding protein YceD (DUF177 family)
LNNNFKQFLIPFKNLGIGVYTYEFIIRNWFFEKFDYSEIKKGRVKIKLLLEKQTKMLFLNFSINGFVNVRCDRCLEYFDYPIKGENELIVKFGKKTSEETDEILILSEYEHQIDISQYIYEFICLLLPMKHIHPVDENGISMCNKNMIKKFEELKNNKKNDHRWDALKKIKKQIKHP